MNFITNLWYLAPIAAIIALDYSSFFYISVSKEDEGTPRMKEIAGYVKDGAMAYLARQYKIITYVFAIIFVLLLLLWLHLIFKTFLFHLFS